ncbi:MAG: hypothetical protein NXI08_16700 [bacterium]|nr:hypothetical protein [bacterium]
MSLDKSIKRFQEIIKEFLTKENSDVLRIYNFRLNLELFNELKNINAEFKRHNIGELVVVLEDINIEIDLSGNEIFQDFFSKSTCLIMLNKFDRTSLIFFTELGIEVFLSGNSLKGINQIKLAFTDKPFNTSKVSFIPIGFEDRNKESSNIELNAVKYVKGLNEEAISVLPKDVLCWIVEDDSVKDSPSFWIKSCLPKVIPLLSNEFEKDDSLLKLLFTGRKNTQIVIDLKEKISNSEYKTINSAAKWVYHDGRDIDTRHSIFVNQVSNIVSTPEINLKNICIKFAEALKNSELAYKYHLREESKELNELLISLNNTLFEYSNKIRKNTTDLINSMWKDLTTILGFLILRYAIKKPELSDQFFRYVGVGLVIYLIFSFYLNSNLGFWFYRNLKDSINQWKGRIYGYLDDNQFNELIIGPLKKAQNKYRNTFLIVLLFYLVFIFTIGASIFGNELLNFIQSMKPAANSG